MRFPRGDREDAITRDPLLANQHYAAVPGQQAIPKHAMTPGKLIAAAFDIRHHFEITVLHIPDRGWWICEWPDQALHSATSRVAMHRSLHDLAFCEGLRSR